MSGRTKYAPAQRMSPRDWEAKKNKDLLGEMDDANVLWTNVDMKSKTIGSKESTPRGAAGIIRPPRIASVATNGKLADTH